MSSVEKAVKLLIIKLYSYGIITYIGDATIPNMKIHHSRKAYPDTRNTYYTKWALEIMTVIIPSLCTNYKIYTPAIARRA